jgi:FkbM family methyltransferase
MQLHKATLYNKFAKKAAPFLSRIVCSPVLHKPTRVLDAYLNFLMGKGSGTGWYLAHEIQVAVSLSRREAPVFFDVGANVGEWSKGVLEAMPQARVFIFEPAPECQQHILNLKLSNSVLVPSAAGDRAGKAMLHSSSALDGTASLYARGETYFRDREYKRVAVEIVTIDDVIQKYGLGFVDFVKMDIEGHELCALRGATQALTARKIGALSFEFGSGNVNSRTFFRDFWDLLTPLGFDIWRITPGGKLQKLAEYYEDCEYFRGVSNYVATLRGRMKS